MEKTNNCLSTVNAAQRRRYYKRTKHNYNRIKTELNKMERLHGIECITKTSTHNIKYCDLQNKYNLMKEKLNYIEKYISYYDKNNHISNLLLKNISDVESKKNFKKILRYNNGQPVPINSIDYIILSAANQIIDM